MAKLYHPDVNPSGKEKFQKISEAYEWLKDNHVQVKVVERENIHKKRYEHFMIYIEGEYYSDLITKSLDLYQDSYIIPISKKFQECEKIVIKILPEFDKEINITLKPTMPNGAIADLGYIKFKLMWN